jgi:patatin-like phospholipase/acyl hydrolase
MQCKYRVILSIDGGGIKGVVPLRILSHIQTEIAKVEEGVDMAEMVDVFAGSSTGSIIGGALMLQDKNGDARFSPQQILDLYTRRGPQIFSKNLGKDPEHSVYPLSFVLNHFFGDITLESIRKRFLFVSYDLNAESQYLFTDTVDRYRSLPLSKIMIACSAFPGVYPPLELGEMLLADGIVAAKNPSELAYNYARLFYPNDPLIVLSIGTGQAEFIEMDVIEQEMEGVHQKMLRNTKLDRNLIYFRLQPTLENPPNSDEEYRLKDMESMIADTEKYIDGNGNEFSRLFQLMKFKVEQMA